MKPLHFFLILLTISYSSCFGQKNETIAVKEEYIPLKTYENDKLVKNDSKKTVLSYVYKLSSKKDTIKYYNNSNPTESSDPVSFF